MSLYSNWMSKAFTKEGRSIDAVWDQYVPKEQRIYEYILGEKIDVLEGKIAELAAKFNMTAEEIVAFVDGINEAISNSYDVNALEENSHVRLEIDFERLFKKMVEYKAEHLYSLPQWNNIFDLKKRHELTMIQKKSRTIIRANKVGRNDPCPCGSGKKFKRCCGA